MGWRKWEGVFEQKGAKSAKEFWNRRERREWRREAGMLRMGFFVLLIVRVVEFDGRSSGDERV